MSVHQMDQLGFSEAFAISAGMVQAFVAVVFARFRALRPEWGLGWLALTYGMAATLNLGAPLTYALQRADNFASVATLLTVLLGVSTIFTLVVGVRRYTGANSPAPWVVCGLVCLVYFSTAVTRKVIGLSPSLAGNVVTALIFVHLAWRCAQAGRREPGAGHGVAALMIGMYPPMIAIGWLAGLDQFELRYWSTVPFALAGLGVMSATMGRMRAQLTELNATLESKVLHRTQALQDMLTSLESFSSMVSHDVKGTLGGISGLSKVVAQVIQAGDTTKAIRLLGTIERESSQMVGVTSDLLLLAKTSQAEVNKERIALSEAVEGALSALEMQWGEDRCRSVQVGHLPDVTADPGLLRQVLINLLGNALKFSQDVSTPKVEIGASLNNAGVLVYVRDNGAGFDPAEAKGLFRPFSQLRSSGSHEGTGIGLTIVRRIIERHGGHVSAEGRPGEGATFSFWLPGERAAHHMEADSKSL